ncbi:MAG: hypothetical protein GOMPHAMPRED_005947 [Gomphillus americanus]|uniref:Protein arginine methyltransferase NDUFAF7 n=1 Tax=Gomphillus americanus TaxID=1940652 RepID=A0A8H3ISF0_9LECA|nr:MAG: hypothetical protein GOMPHAMPRED_005947 [Gomphillus americanus]
MSKVLRTLFSHQTCSRLRYSYARSKIPCIRSLSTSRPAYKPKPIAENDPANAESFWQPRNDFMSVDKAAEYQRYEMVTADDLRGRKQRPRRVKMLMRDFIEDSLYNPNYGYFSKQVTIFNPGDAFQFNAMADEAEFYKLLSIRYKQFEDELDTVSLNETRQLWHTPTELFRPYYGEAIARSLVEQYKLTHHPYHDLIIYEMGAGNGTMMLNILDHIRDFYPEIYPQTQFKIIEISTQLAELQNAGLYKTAASKGHLDHVQIINKSIFDWDMYVPEPCWFLALEVFDNFAHDIIRYDPGPKQAMQGSILVDSDGEFYEFYNAQIDPIASRFMQTRNEISHGSLPRNHPLNPSFTKRLLQNKLPFAPNLTSPEYIPTRLMQFFEVLKEYFPQHRLLTSDFHILPDTIDGYNAPVVQTRFQRKTIPVRTPLVHQGFFDILFPTDFVFMADLYKAITGKRGKVSTHSEFLSHWAYTEDTKTKNGENPMLSWYRNASVMMTE